MQDEECYRRTYEDDDIRIPLTPLTRSISPKVFERICVIMNLPEGADELDLLIAITKLVENQPQPTMIMHSPFTGNTTTTSYRKDLNADQ